MNVSVIIATYGDSDWHVMAAERALPSAYAETPANSGHHTVGVHLKDGTIAKARNACAARARGDWLCFLDADDELAPGYLEAMGRAAEQNPGGRVLLTPAVQQIRKGRPGNPFFFPECSLTTGNWLIIGTLIQRDLFNEVGGFSEHPHGLEDWNLWAKAVKAGATIVKVPDAVYRAHMNPRSKHHVLQRDRRQYMVAYEVARSEVWG